MLRADGAPDSLNMCLPISMVVAKAVTSIAVINSTFKSSTPDFARSRMRSTPS